MKKSLCAFTLIELMVVIAILASIAFPVFTSVQERARAVQDLNNLRQIGSVLFTSGDIWMSLLYPKYLPSWKIFQSPFDKRNSSEDNTSAPISYGVNGNTNVVGISMDKVKKPSVFIMFGPAQAAGTTLTFSGKPTAAVTVYKNSVAAGGVQNKRTRINALFADLHADSLTWATFSSDTATTADPDAAYRWAPDQPWP